MRPEILEMGARLRAYANGYNHGVILRGTTTERERETLVEKARKDYRNASDSLESRYYFGVLDGLEGRE